MLNNQIAIAIVDDNTLFRCGLVNLMEGFDEIKVIFEAVNGLDFHEKLRQHEPIEIVLMDINMPFMDGYATTRWLKTNYPEINILVLSMFEDEKAIIDILKAGADGYLLKKSTPCQLMIAIKNLKEKGFYINDLLTHRLLAVKKEPVKTVFTEKELIFLQFCSTEFTYRKIATLMNVSHRTVDNYRESLFYKLNIKSRTGLVVYGIRNGLIRI